MKYNKYSTNYNIQANENLIKVVYFLHHVRIIILKPLATVNSLSRSGMKKIYDTVL